MSAEPLRDELGRLRDYVPRVADAELAARLRATGAVLIEGARGCGKTETGLRAARRAVRLDRDPAARRAGTLDPTLLLAGERPRLVDEWQLVPDVWNAVRADVDDHPEEPGRFILAGSAVPADDATRHTGSLRFTRLRMRPMSLAESGHSSRAVSLADLFAGAGASAADPGLGVRDLAERIDREDLDVMPDDFLVLKNAGPMSGTGMPEAGYLPIPGKLARAGVKDMVRISDARMSGTAFGTVVLHVSPEAAAGGPLALVRNGDRIAISVAKRSIDLLVDERELDRRRHAAVHATQPPRRGHARLYAEHVLQADEGCDFDFLRGT